MQERMQEAAQDPAQDQFIYTPGDVLRMLDTLVGDRGSEWWGEFFADRACSGR
jgi:hypothetical protein